MYACNILAFDILVQSNGYILIQKYYIYKDIRGRIPLNPLFYRISGYPVKLSQVDALLKFILIFNRRLFENGDVHKDHSLNPFSEYG